MKNNQIKMEEKSHMSWIFKKLFIKITQESD